MGRTSRCGAHSARRTGCRSRSRIDPRSARLNRRGAARALGNRRVAPPSQAGTEALRLVSGRARRRRTFEIQCAIAPADELREERRIRLKVDKERLHQFVEALAEAATERTQLFLTGGATAVFYGWRESTIDIDIRLVPESDDILRAIPAIKERLHVNVELAAPDDFIPVKEGWEDRSPFAMQAGSVTVRHFDLYAQALSKIERGTPQDIQDVGAMMARKLIDATGLRDYFQTVLPLIYRYPALDEQKFRSDFEEFMSFQKY